MHVEAEIFPTGVPGLPDGHHQVDNSLLHQRGHSLLGVVGLKLV